MKMSMTRGTRGRDTERFDHDLALALRLENTPVEEIARQCKTSAHRIYKLFEEVDTLGERRTTNPKHWRKQGYDWGAARSMARMARAFISSAPRDEGAT